MEYNNHCTPTGKYINQLGQNSKKEVVLPDKSKGGIPEATWDEASVSFIMWH